MLSIDARWPIRAKRVRNYVYLNYAKNSDIHSRSSQFSNLNFFIY